VVIGHSDSIACCTLFVQDTLMTISDLLEVAFWQKYRCGEDSLLHLFDSEIRIL
jgi:hypothetical protein